MNAVRRCLPRKNPFGSLAISNETHGFASRPHSRFAFVEELDLSSRDDEIFEVCIERLTYDDVNANQLRISPSRTSKHIASYHRDSLVVVST